MDYSEGVKGYSENNLNKTSACKQRICLELNAQLIYREYPRKSGARAAIKAIVVCLQRQKHEHPEVENHLQYLLDKVRAYADIRKKVDPNMSWTPHCSTWFNQGRYDDDPSAWLHGKEKLPEHRDPVRIHQSTELEGRRQDLLQAYPDRSEELLRMSDEQILALHLKLQRERLKRSLGQLPWKQ